MMILRLVSPLKSPRNCAIVAGVLMKVRHSGTGLRQAPNPVGFAPGGGMKASVVRPITETPAFEDSVERA